MYFQLSVFKFRFSPNSFYVRYKRINAFVSRLSIISCIFHRFSSFSFYVASVSINESQTFRYCPNFFILNTVNHCLSYNTIPRIRWVFALIGTLGTLRLNIPILPYYSKQNKDVFVYFL